MTKRKNGIIAIFTCAVVLTFMFSIIGHNSADSSGGVLLTNANGALSNKKICWGIKREPNHKQPDVGTANKSVLDNYNGICMGDSESKKVYLTFDSRI